MSPQRRAPPRSTYQVKSACHQVEGILEKRSSSEAEDKGLLQNPLRLILIRFACSICGCVDPEGCQDENRAFRCRRCAESREASFAYCSLLYGGAPHLILGALALGLSLRASGTTYERVLLHTADLPEQARHLLRVFWRLTEVNYIISAPDLHTAPYETARFREVFTKLHVFNPKVLPFDKVVFLDIDTLVLKNIDSLFELRTPAAMCNMKTKGGRALSPPRHGEPMQPYACYFNAGTMLVAPSQLLFDLLSADVQEPDSQWHAGAWSPEQNYLSRVLAGQWSHLSQLFNFEVQLHSGVPLSSTWENARAENVFVAHFSGAKKVWDCTPVEETSPIGSDWVRETFAQLTASTQALAATRCAAFHSHWHRALALALRDCCQQGLGHHAIGEAWAAACSTGEFCEPPRSSPQNSWQIGDEVVFQSDCKELFLGTVLRMRDSVSGAIATVWLTPSPGQDAFCAGPFGICSDVPVDSLRSLESVQQRGLKFAVGTVVVAWLGEGHAQGLVTGMRLEDDERLVRFSSRKSPYWYSVDELRPGWVADGIADPLQCVDCLRRPSRGQFKISDGFWYCHDCWLPAAERLSVASDTKF